MNSWFLLVNSRIGESYWVIPSLADFLLFWRHHGGPQVLLYAQSKCVGGCSLCIQIMAGAAIFHQVGALTTQPAFIIYVNRAAPAIF
jgi:hypothetical protein